MAKEKHALEKAVTDEIHGRNYGGMQSAYAFTFFRENYYEKIQDQGEKAVVRTILIDLLKNDHFDPILRSKVAWICADIAMPGIEEELAKMLKEPAIKTSVVRELTYTLERFRLEKKIKEMIERLNFSDIKDDATANTYSNFRIKYFDQIKEPSEKTEVANLLIKIITSSQYDQVTRIKAAWICAYLGIHSIKEAIVKMANEPVWRGSSFRRSLDDIIAFIDDRESRK